MAPSELVKAVERLLETLNKQGEAIERLEGALKEYSVLLEINTSLRSLAEDSRRADHRLRFASQHSSPIRQLR